MSKPIRIALISEGITDNIVIDSILKSLLKDEEFQLKSLQPIISETFREIHNKGDIEGGWTGIYHWIQEIRNQTDSKFSDHFLPGKNDIIIIQIDADVAGKTYKSGRITNLLDDLPCKIPCPLGKKQQNKKPCRKDCSVPRQNTDALQKVVLGWMGEADVPAKIVFCIPAQAMEAWVVAALCPDHKTVTSGKLECYTEPQKILENLPLKKRIHKTAKDYLDVKDQLSENWEKIRNTCKEAERFNREFCTKILQKSINN